MTNLSLFARSGTELHTRDLALELLRRGHAPTVYSPMPGEVAAELCSRGVRVVSNLIGEREAPDVIHGHHHVETMSAVLRFPGVPAVFVCHDRTAWHDHPPRHPRLRAYVAVDESCRARIVEEGVNSAQIQVVPNAVDLDRFRERAPLPLRPRRALVFSHYAAENMQLPIIRDACRRLGLEINVIGRASGNECSHPEVELANYDIVFAKARCALEAMAVGCAVVLCDHLGVGPLVRADEWLALRPLNFGRRACVHALTAENFVAEIAHYDAADAAQVCRQTRAEADVGRTAEAFISLYERVIGDQRSAPADPEAEAQAAAEYLRTRCGYGVVTQIGAAEAEHWRASAEAAHRGWGELHNEYLMVREARDAGHRGWAELGLEYERVLTECSRLQGLLNQRRAGWLSRWKS